MALEEFAKLAADLGLGIAGLAAGTVGTYKLMKSVYSDRFEATKSANDERAASLERAIDYLKKEIDHTEKQCETRMNTLQQNNNALNDRIKTLEDSRTFILTNYIKKDAKND